MDKLSIKRTVIFCIAVIATGCRREELPVAIHEAGNIITASVDMDPLYKYQVYYNLRSNTVVGRNEKTVWDLGFETSADGYHVVLNGAKSMFAIATTKTDISAVTIADSAGFAGGRRWDSYRGSMDSTAIGDWRGTNPVYIIDRGYNETGIHQGWAKVQVLSVNATEYKVRFAKLNGADDAAVTITKDSSYNLSYLSFSTKAQVMVEPPKATWDLVFSQYTFVFYDIDPPTPYLVTGCLLNRYNTYAYADTGNKFEQTNFGSVQTERLINDISAIGYDWKVFNGTKYTVRAGNNYIIRDAGGLYYKLRFTGFYNASGVKGNPQWEYQKL